MNLNHLKLGGVLVAIAALSPTAHAGFQLESQPAQANAQRDGAAKRQLIGQAMAERVKKGPRQRIDLDSKLTARITQSGDTPAELPILTGMGRQVSFEDALRQILPAGWSAFTENDLPLETQITWSGNKTWPMVLDTVLTEKHMRAHIDWASQEVTFFADNTETALSAKDSTGTPTRTSLPPLPQHLSKTGAWTLQPEFSLRDNMRRWASEANWNLVWNALNGDSVIDYPVDAKVDFAGELIGSDGAMAKVISAYGDAEFPLEIEFFRGNKVIEVRLHRVPDVKPVPLKKSAPMNTAPRTGTQQQDQDQTISSRRHIFRSR